MHPLADDWQPIATAPRCVDSSPGDSGRRVVLVTRWPYNGQHPPVALAKLTREGWKVTKTRRLWFEPTHWRALPPVLDTAAVEPPQPGEAALAAKDKPARGMVRLHPLPQNANPDLVTVLGVAIAGAVKSALAAHCRQMPRAVRGMLIGSIRKRAVNQLVSEQGEALLRRALEKSDSA